MLLNYLEINYYNGYGRWYGKDRFTFPEIDYNGLESIEIKTPYYEIVAGFDDSPWYEDNTKDIENQLRCTECTSFQEALKYIERFL